MRFATFALTVLLTACSSTAEAPEPTPTPTEAPEPTPTPGRGVLLPGEQTANTCEESLVAYAEYVRDSGFEMIGDYELNVFGCCNFADFVAANAKMADRFRISDPARHLERKCDSFTSVYAGEFLCLTRGD